MSSTLECLPCELLQAIAILSIRPHTAPSPFADVANLMLTSRTIYSSLCFRDHPHLYGKIFRSQFNTEAPLRRHAFLTDFALSAELFQRLATLQHIRRLSISSDISQDLWTIQNMLMESEGLNHSQLYEAGVMRYLVKLLESRIISEDGWPRNDATDAVACCCLVLTLTHAAVVDSAYKRHVINIVRPFTLNILRPNVKYEARTFDVNFYGKSVTIYAPRAASVAIRLMMSLVEELPLQRPIDLQQRACENETSSLLIHPATHHIYPKRPPSSTSMVFDSGYDTLLGARTCFESSMSVLQNHQLAGSWNGTYLVAPFHLTEAGCKTVVTPTSDYVAREVFECILEPRSPHEAEDSVNSDGRTGLTGIAGDFQWEGDMAQGGLVTLRRRSVFDPSEAWLFEGYIYNNGVLIGRWMSGLSFVGVGDCLSGIFILHKET